jgi:hypothetical protein
MSDYQMCVIIAFIFLARSLRTDEAVIFTLGAAMAGLMFKLAEIYQ